MTVRLSANGCLNDVPVVNTLSYVHTVSENPDKSAIDAVTLIDDNNDIFLSGSTPATDNSFIVTGSAHTLNPFVTGANCRETVIWSYFEISSSGRDTFSNNIGRNSIIECDAGGVTTSCNVFYLGSGFKR